MKTSIAFLTLLASPAAGQGALWVVDDDPGPGVDFADVQAAIDAASDGDVVLVRDGTYTGFEADGRTLAVVGEDGARPLIQGPTGVLNVPPGGWFVLEGLELEYFFFLFSQGYPLEIRDCAGQVRVEDCLIQGNATRMVWVRGSSSVDVTRCTVESPPLAEYPLVLRADGVVVSSSTVSLHECDVSASLDVVEPAPHPFPGDGSNGLSVTGSSFVVVSASTLRGGAGTVANPDGTPQEEGCEGPNAPGEGGDAVFLGIGDPVVVLRDATLVPGPSGTTFGCPPAASGEEVFTVSGTVTSLPGVPRGFESTTPVLAGNDATLSFRGEPGDLAISLATTTPAWLYLPPYAAVLLVDPLAFPGFLGVVPASGTLDVTLPVDPLPPGWGSGVLFLQGVAFDAALAGHVGSPALLVMTASS